MTIRIGRDAHGHHRHGWGTVRNAATGGTSPFVPKKETRVGIERAPRDRVASTLPLSAFHQTVLDAMTVGEIVSVRSLGVSASTLYVLQDRGLVERVPYKGWRRVR